MPRKFTLLFSIIMLGTGLAGCELPEQFLDEDSSPTAQEAEISDKEGKKSAPVGKGEELFRFVVLGDSHGDTQDYPRLLQQAKQDNPAFLIHVGDLTKVGDVAALAEAKTFLENTGLAYYVLPGDHDIATSLDISNFEQVFGASHSSFIYAGYRLVLMDNSDTALAIAQEQWDWLADELGQIEPVILFQHNPIEHTLFSAHTMLEAEEGAKDAQRLKELLIENEVAYVFAGEMHLYSQFQISNSEIPMTVVGAAGEYSNPSEAQYVLVLVYNTGAIETEQKLLKSE